MKNSNSIDLKLELIERLKKEEGVYYHLYPDHLQKWTIGVGRNVEDAGLTLTEQLLLFNEEIAENNTQKGRDRLISYLQDRKIILTQNQCDILLNNDVEKRMGYFNGIDWYNDLSNARKLVILDMSFQMGINGLLKFKKMIEAIKKSNFTEAAVEMKNSEWYRKYTTRAKQLVKIMHTDIYEKYQ